MPISVRPMRWAQTVPNTATISAARAGVLRQFLRYGQDQVKADRYVVFFYGHAYGPMGAEGLTTSKFIIRGTGQVR